MVETVDFADDPVKAKRCAYYGKLYFEWKDSGKCPEHLLGEGKDPEAFIYWDLKENGCRALDYDYNRNYTAGLIEQARKFLTAYTRIRMPIALGGVTIPSVFSTKDGYVPTRLANPAQLAAFLKLMGNKIRTMAIRARIMGASMGDVRKEIRKAERAAANYRPPESQV